jgi:hypothetical protein
MEQENGTKRQTAASGLGELGWFDVIGISGGSGSRILRALGHGFFTRSESRILRGGVWLIWLGDAEIGIVWGLGSVGEASRKQFGVHWRI